MTDEERLGRFQLVLATAEMEIKCRMVEIAEENLDTNNEKIGFMTALSMAVCNAALHGACEAVEERGGHEVGQMTLDLFNSAVQPNLTRLKRLMDSA